MLLAILVLCMFGTICSLTTKSLHRIVLWFAPINSKSPRQKLLNGDADLFLSTRINQHMHRPADPDPRKAECNLGLYTYHGRLGMGQSRLLLFARVGVCCLTGEHLLTNVFSFLSVAWTMTDYDGTTQ